MAKTIGRIALVAAAVAVSVGSFGIGAAITGALGATLGGAVTATVVGLGVTALTGLLGLGPKAPKPQVTESTVKSPQPPRVYGYGRRKLNGAKILFETNSVGATVDAYAFADGEADGVEQVYLNDDKVTIVGNTVQTLPDKKYQSGLVKAGFNLGRATETAFAAVIAALPGIWTNSHRGDGVVTGYLIKNPEKEKYLLTTYPQGDAVELSAVFRLQKCLDPRNGNKVWTENPVLHTLDYLLNKRGYSYQKHIVPALQFWVDAANICDEAVALKSGGAEPRYRSCVVYDSTAQPKEVLGSLLETFDGWLGQRGDGALVIYAGKMYTPTVTIGPDEIYDYSLSFGIEGDQRVDQLSVSYVSAAHDYNVVEATPWGGEAGALRTDSFAPQTPSFSQNRRLAKRAFSRANEMDRGSVTTNLLGRKARGQRYINLHIEESGIIWFSGIAEITNVKRDFAAGGLSFDWIAVDGNIDSWNPATEEGEPAPTGNRVAPQPLAVPTIGSAQTFFASATDGGTGARIRVTAASPSQRADYVWYVRWRVLGDSAWNEQAYPDIGSGTVTLETGLVPTNSQLEVGIAYGQGDGRVSDYSATALVDSDTEATPPDAAGTPRILDWRTILRIEMPPAPRAKGYVWRIYAQDGTTLIRTVYTSGPILEYTPSQAATDGVRRSYVVTGAGTNAGGEGPVSTTGVITNPPPPKVQNVVTASGDYIASLSFDALTDSDLAGYVIFYAKAQGFDPSTQGFAELRGAATTQELYNLAGGTYYARVAGYDGWSNDPALLNLSDEKTFTINAGSSGGVGGGGGGGGGDGGGGYLPNMPD